MIFFSAYFFLMLYLCKNKIEIIMKKIGVLTAMSVEYNQLASMLADSEQVVFGSDKYLCGKIGNLEVVLLRCGMGKVNAAMGVTLLIDRFQPEAVISTGVAGGVDDSLHVMDVVVSRQTVYHDVWCGPGNVWGQVQELPERYDGAEPLVKTALSIHTNVNIVEGLICTGDLFVTKPEEQQLIKSRFPEALAVDMESAAIAQVCHIRQVPFVSFRIISDTPGHKDNLSQYADFWKTMADKSFTVTREYLISL